MPDVDGVNAGYARLLLDEYLDNPEAVPPEWRALFENGDTAVVRDLPGHRSPAAMRPPAPRAGATAPAAAATGVSRPAAPGRRGTTPSCSAASRPRWRSSRLIACTGISRRASIRSAPSRSAIRRSTRSDSSPG